MEEQQGADKGDKSGIQKKIGKKEIIKCQMNEQEKERGMKERDTKN